MNEMPKSLFSLSVWILFTFPSMRLPNQRWNDRHGIENAPNTVAQMEMRFSLPIRNSEEIVCILNWDSFRRKLLYQLTLSNGKFWMIEVLPQLEPHIINT